ncbi:helix-turn-helix domain-containing protein [Rhodococcus opacus]|uniref:helix-turn-helix domain-containing protein n=1 Tax=Rhodococcus opacus TaxID=37919 RepID=UPI001F58B5FB|nr:helix-turn-helix transcriptional regulator [Rhodococcus opacus]UNN00738.1 helix-turn-helix domain-containing protein [Rhodococcus opacus]
MSEKKNPLGPSGRATAGNIKRLREEQKITYAELSRMLADIGRPIPTLGLSRIEANERRIDIDDLIALSVALEVSPNTLLMPYETDDEAEVEVTGAAHPIPAKDAYYFLEGVKSLGPGNNLEFAVRSLPDFMQIRRSGRRRDSWSEPGRTWIHRAIETDGRDVQWSVTEAEESVLAREDEDD